MYVFIVHEVMATY